MKIKSLVAALLTTIAAASASAASPTFIYSTPITIASFDDWTVGTISISSLSNLAGSLFAADSITFSTPINFTLSLDQVTFTSGYVGTPSFPPLVDLDTTDAGFSFQNVGVGNYLVKASGNLSPGGQVANLALIGASYTVTLVPEPETYAMLLVGLGLMGAVARRRNKSDSDQA